MKFYSIKLILKQVKNIKNIDPKYYSILGVILKIIDENEEIYKNITISPLGPLKDGNFYCKICLFGESIYNNFLNYINNATNQIIKIDSIPFSLIGYEKTGDDYCLDLNIETKIKPQPYSGIKIKFLSPTVVKANQIYKLFPKSEIYLYSLINRVEKILGKDVFFENFGFMNTDKIQALLEDGLIEADYDLHIEKIFIKGGYVPGNVGYIKYAINRKFNDEVFENLKQSLHSIIKTANRSGLGYGTRLGFGQIFAKTY